MIRGIGIDVVEIARVEEMLQRWGNRFGERVFTPEELAYAGERTSRAASLAARFAAKEAFAKALGTGWDRTFNWKDFGVHNTEGGRPVGVLSPAMQQRLGTTRVLLSMSHSDHYAVAVVLLEEGA